MAKSMVLGSDKEVTRWLSYPSTNGQLWNAVCAGDGHSEWIKGDGTLQHPFRVELPPEYAAAPEMLAVLKEVQRHHQGGHSELGAKLRAVIAKAGKLC